MIFDLADVENLWAFMLIGWSRVPSPKIFMGFLALAIIPLAIRYVVSINASDGKCEMEPMFRVVYLIRNLLLNPRSLGKDLVRGN